MLPGSKYTPFPDGITFGRSGVAVARMETNAVANGLVDRIEALGPNVPNEVRDVVQGALQAARPVQSISFVATGSCDDLPNCKMKAELWKLTGVLQFSVATAEVKLSADIRLLTQWQSHCVDISSELIFADQISEWTVALGDYYRRATFGGLEEGEEPPPQPEPPTDPIPIGRKMNFRFQLIWYADIEVNLGAASSVVRIIVQTDNFDVSTRCCFPD